MFSFLSTFLSECTQFFCTKLLSVEVEWGKTVPWGSQPLSWITGLCVKISVLLSVGCHNKRTVKRSVVLMCWFCRVEVTRSDKKMCVLICNDSFFRCVILEDFCIENIVRIFIWCLQKGLQFHKVSFACPSRCSLNFRRLSLFACSREKTSEKIAR